MYFTINQNVVVQLLFELKLNKNILSLYCVYLMLAVVRCAKKTKQKQKPIDNESISFKCFNTEISSTSTSGVNLKMLNFSN